MRSNAASRGHGVCVCQGPAGKSVLHSQQQRRQQPARSRCHHRLNLPLHAALKSGGLTGSFLSPSSFCRQDTKFTEGMLSCGTPPFLKISTGHFRLFLSKWRLLGGVSSPLGTDIFIYFFQTKCTEEVKPEQSVLKCNFPK